MKKAKILVVGSFMMDLIASAPRVPNLGETVIGTSFQTAPEEKVPIRHCSVRVWAQM